MEEKTRLQVIQEKIVEIKNRLITLSLDEKFIQTKILSGKAPKELENELGVVQSTIRFNKDYLVFFQRQLEEEKNAMVKHALEPQGAPQEA